MSTGAVSPHAAAEVDGPAAPASVRLRFARLISISLAVGLAAAAAQVALGAYGTSWASALRALTDGAFWGHPGTVVRMIFGHGLADRLGLADAVALPTETLVVWSVRVPRVLVAALVGMNLSVSGAIFQAITRNELASPYLLGVSSGAGLAVLLVLTVFPHLTAQLPLVASLGGGAAFLLVYSIAWKNGTSSVRLVLAGVIVASIAGSLQSALMLFIRELYTSQDAAAWLTGSLTAVGWTQLRYAAPWTLLVVASSLCFTRHMDLLLLGDARARSLGLAVERARFGLAAIAIVGAATTVSVAGLVGFVGLIVPHIVRSTVSSTSKVVLAGGLAVGPALMLSADAIARLLLRPMQLPVGVITGVLGGVWFLVLMRRRGQVARP